MNKNHIVVLGSVNMDLVLRCPTLPRPGETLSGREFRTVPGGKGANQAVAAARLGGAVSFVGCVGDDAYGRMARDTLEAEAIDTTHLHTLPGVASGIAMIFVDDAGQNCIGLAAGANAALSVEHVEQAAPLITSAAVLVCQLESPLPVVLHAIALAHRAGVPVLLNPAPAQALPEDLAPRVTWLVPNEGEAQELADLGSRGAGADAAGPEGAGADGTEVATRLRAQGWPAVIVTLGGKGVCLADAAGLRRFPPPAVSAIDTTGAGDTFTGALAVACCERLSLEVAIGFAQRAAAISVTRPGAMPSMPRRAELEPQAEAGTAGTTGATP